MCYVIWLRVRLLGVDAGGWFALNDESLLGFGVGGYLLCSRRCDLFGVCGFVVWFVTFCFGLGCLVSLGVYLLLVGVSWFDVLAGL